MSLNVQNVGSMPQTTTTDNKGMDRSTLTYGGATTAGAGVIGGIVSKFTPIKEDTLVKRSKEQIESAKDSMKKVSEELAKATDANTDKVELPKIVKKITGQKDAVNKKTFENLQKNISAVSEQLNKTGEASKDIQNTAKNIIKDGIGKTEKSVKAGTDDLTKLVMDNSLKSIKNGKMLKYGTAGALIGLATYGACKLYANNKADSTTV